MSVAQTPAAMTVAEFMARRDERREKLVDGVVVAMAPVSPRHGAIAAREAYLLTGRDREHSGKRLGQAELLIDIGSMAAMRYSHLGSALLVSKNWTFWKARAAIDDDSFACDVA